MTRQHSTPELTRPAGSVAAQPAAAAVRLLLRQRGAVTPLRPAQGPQLPGTRPDPRGRPRGSTAGGPAGALAPGAAERHRVPLSTGVGWVLGTDAGLLIVGAGATAADAAALATPTNHRRVHAVLLASADPAHAGAAARLCQLVTAPVLVLAAAPGDAAPAVLRALAQLPDPPPLYGALRPGDQLRIGGLPAVLTVAGELALPTAAVTVTAQPQAPWLVVRTAG